MPAEYFPLFYYGGSKKHGIPSGRPFIEARISCLPDVQRQLVASEYDEIYKRNWNAGRYREARYEANAFLNNYVRDVFQGTTEQERETHIVNEDWIKQRIAKVREAQKSTRKKISPD
ncbi:hypothetical protein MARILYN_24 [Vibrio phage Marilyn]|nr:hypothetical protein MARILYN_24 [Vibrio phage Marilyn]WCD55547.1 hypothetical protein FAYDEN_24 [Vibrio phage Fayden]WCD55604.1 hypothetical protein BAYBAE_24 [Vibrio phage Baybae]WCD55663.1 hypothetical protein VAITEPHAGE_24 [Vibrio phage Vaitephage]